MSQSTIVRRKSSPCCIGCIILLVLGIGIAVAMGIWGYRFFKENIGFHNVANVPDPALDAPPEVLFPATVGEFSRVSLNEEVPQIPGAENLDTTGVVTAEYEDPQAHHISALAIPTNQARSQRQQGMGPLTVGRGRANAPNMGVSIKNPVDGGSTTLTWAKENWTFMLYTTSTVAAKFVESYRPEGAQSGSSESEAVETGSGAVNTRSTDSESTPAEELAPAVAPTEGRVETTETL